MNEDLKFARQLKLLSRLGSGQIGSRQQSNFRAHDMLIDSALELFTKKIPENLDKHVWFSLLMPPEIIHSMGLPAIESDTIGAFLCSFGYTNRLINYVEQETGISQVCSYHKSLIGALHLNVIHVPKAIIVSSTSCDAVQKSSIYIHETFGSELFLIDTPAVKSREGLEYIKNQLIELTSFLSSVTGTEFSMEKFLRAVRLSNQACQIWKKAHDLRVGKSLFPEAQKVGQFIAFHTNFGTENGVEIAKAFYEEVKERSKRSSRISDDKCRLMWFHNMPSYSTFLDNIEESVGASVVVESFGYPWYYHIDEDDPFLSLAEKIMDNPYIGVDEAKSEFTVRLAEKFRVDGVIQFMHMGCRANFGMSRIVEDALKERGIPILHLDGDAVDSRNYSDAQARTRVQAFVESILNRKRLRR